MKQVRMKMVVVALGIILLLTCAVACGVQEISKEEKDNKSMSQAPPATYVGVDVYWHEDAPIYTSINQLVADSDYVFKGKLESFEPVDGESWQWVVFKVVKHYKGNSCPEVLRLVATLDGAQFVQGKEYYVFAEVNDIPCYPHPYVMPIGNLAIFEVSGGEASIVKHSFIRDRMPAVCDTSFLKNPEEAILSSTSGLSSVRAIPHVVERYDSLSDMVSASDLIVRVEFGEVEKVNQYVTCGYVKSITSEYSSGKEIPIPSSIYVNEEVRPGEIYYIFLEADPQGEIYRLTARHGAIISTSDEELCKELGELLRRKK